MLLKHGEGRRMWMCSWSVPLLCSQSLKKTSMLMISLSMIWRSMSVPRIELSVEEKQWGKAAVSFIVTLEKYTFKMHSLIQSINMTFSIYYLVHKGICKGSAMTLQHEATNSSTVHSHKLPAGSPRFCCLGSWCFNRLFSLAHCSQVCVNITI